ncbi:unnamed protein product, partial [Oppiella nova]
PADRARNLKQFIQKVTSNEKVIEEQQRWQLEFDKNLVRVKGRVLPCERIIMQGDTPDTGAQFEQKSGDFGRQIRSKRLFKGLSVNKWHIIYTKRDEGLLQEFLNGLKKVSTPLGVNLLRPSQECLPDDRIGTFVRACQQTVAPMELVVCIVPNNNKERYDAIKKIHYCENPMSSQVVVGKTLTKKQGLLSVCTKVVIQMATKLGAEPWVLKIPPKSIMIVGYDTYHDSSQKGRSVGAFVCSMNEHMSSWFSRVAYHDTSEEMSANFAINIQEGIKRYFEVNRQFPKRVLIYRDGVGDGMIQHVFEYELKAVQSGLKKMYPEGEIPQLAFVIVTKRVNARFFTQEGNTPPDNPIPGTIVDTTVTRACRYDFYL